MFLLIKFEIITTTDVEQIARFIVQALTLGGETVLHGLQDNVNNELLKTHASIAPLFSSCVGTNGNKI